MCKNCLELQENKYMWKEEFKNRFFTYIPCPHDEDALKFIQREIVEKLIDEIPTTSLSYGDTEHLKFLLKDKWLRKEKE